MTIKSLPAFALSALLVFSGCATSSEIPLGTKESKWLGSVLSVKIVEREGDTKVYQTMGGMYYYFKNGVLVHKSDQREPISSIPATPRARVSVAPEMRVQENVTRPTLGAQQVHRTKIQKPEHMHTAFANAINSGDLEQVLALYEGGAVVGSQPGQRMPHPKNLRAVLAELLDLKGTMQATSLSSTRADNIALVQAELRFSYTDKNGAPVERTIRTVEVVRQQADGSWLYAIAQPLLPE